MRIAAQGIALTTLAAFEKKIARYDSDLFFQTYEN